MCWCVPLSIIVVGTTSPNSENFQYHQQQLPRAIATASRASKPKKTGSVQVCVAVKLVRLASFICVVVVGVVELGYMIPLPRYFPLGYYDELDFQYLWFLRQKRRYSCRKIPTNKKKTLVYPSIVLFEKGKTFPIFVYLPLSLSIPIFIVCLHIRHTENGFFESKKKIDILFPLCWVGCRETC
jgi:hypothetical protein